MSKNEHLYDEIHRLNKEQSRLLDQLRLTPEHVRQCQELSEKIKELLAELQRIDGDGSGDD